MIFYTADLHLGDQRVFDLCSKPFADLHEYHTEIVRRWNAKVRASDEIYVLGDVAESNPAMLELLHDLAGCKHLIVGNHDQIILPAIIRSGVFLTISDLKVIEDNGRSVCLCHYPLMEWPGMNNGGYHVFGHIHNKTEVNGREYAQMKAYYFNKRAYNAGVDVTDYSPVTLDEMIALKHKTRQSEYQL